MDGATGCGSGQGVSRRGGNRCRLPSIGVSTAGPKLRRRRDLLNAAAQRPPAWSVVPPLLPVSSFFSRLRRLFSAAPAANGASYPAVDVAREAEAIRVAELTRTPEPGKRIHSFPVQELDLRLDRDVLGTYRVTASEGAERRYSFTLAYRPDDGDALRTALAEVVHFLEGDRSPTTLPRTELIQGHWYGLR